MTDRESDGKWKKGGKSPNPTGRPKVVGDLRDLARVHTTDALATLVEVMNDKEAPPAARVAAAGHVLDRGYGKAATSLDLTVQHSVSETAASVLLELSQRARARRELEQQPIDITPNGHARPIDF